jgi:serine/threonine-protein kinase RsbW
MRDPGMDPGGDSGTAPDSLVLELPSDLDVVEGAVEEMVLHCRGHVAPESRLLLNFRVGVTEALANAILYGNEHDPEKTVRVRVSVTHRSVVVEVSDEGAGFDPQTVPDPTLPENLQRTGGRGVFLIRQLMDEVEYAEPGNTVRLILHRQSKSHSPAGN